MKCLHPATADWSDERAWASVGHGGPARLTRLTCALRISVPGLEPKRVAALLPRNRRVRVSSSGEVMDIQQTPPQQMDWKRFVASLVESLRWPVAIIAIFIILRAPLSGLIHAATAGIAS